VLGCLLVSGIYGSGIGGEERPASPRIDLDRRLEERLGGGEIIALIERLEGSKTRRCRAVGVIQAPIHKVWHVLGDYEGYPEFMPDTPVAFVLDPAAFEALRSLPVENWKQFEKTLVRHRITDYDRDAPFYFFTRVNVPWPMKDRRFVVRVLRNPSTYEIYWHQVLGDLKENRGFWQLYRFGSGQGDTLAVYTIYTDPGVFVPAFFLKLALRGSLPGVIKAVRRRVGSGAASEIR